MTFVIGTPAVRDELPVFLLPLQLHLILDRAVDGTHMFEFLKLYLLPGDIQKIQRMNARTLRQAEDTRPGSDSIVYVSTKMVSN